MVTEVLSKKLSSDVILYTSLHDFMNEFTTFGTKDLKGQESHAVEVQK